MKKSKFKKGNGGNLSVLTLENYELDVDDKICCAATTFSIIIQFSDSTVDEKLILESLFINFEFNCEVGREGRKKMKSSKKRVHREDKKL